jgi:hypothetical protein
MWYNRTILMSVIKIKLLKNMECLKKGMVLRVISPPKDCMTLTLVVGLAWSNESQSYAGGSVATGRVSHARLVCDEDPD